MTIICGACGMANDAWRPYCTRCSSSLADAASATRPPAAVGPSAAAEPTTPATVSFSDITAGSQPAAPPPPGAPAPPPAPVPAFHAAPVGNGNGNGTTIPAAPPWPPAPPPAPPAGAGTPPPWPPQPPGPAPTPPGHWPAPPAGRTAITFGNLTPERPLKRRGRFAVIVPLVLALAGAGALGAYVVHRTSGPSYPSHWDARVLPLVQFVEKTRGMTFDHPVEVDFLSPAAFRKLVTVGDATTKSAAAARRDMRAQLGYLRALGLAQGDVDLAASADKLSGQTVLAFYSDLTKKVTIRGTTLDVSARVTVVHELTHALQDQHFDLQALEKYGNDHKTDAVTALYEGDAVDVENRYERSLSKADQAEYDKEQSQLGGSIDLGGVPDAMAIQEEWPYDFGPEFVAVLRAVAPGTTALDAAFRKPPSDELQIVNPSVFVDGRTPVTPPAPSLTGATNVHHDGEFGVVGWYLMLSEHGDARAALRAIDGWAGDSITRFQRAGTSCVALQWVGTTPAASADLAAQLRSWHAAVPSVDATITTSGVDLALQACDPGSAAKLVTHRSKTAYGLLAFRTALLGEFARQAVADHATLHLAYATCIVDALSAAVPLDKLTDAAYFGAPAWQATLGRAASSCASLRGE